MPFIISWQIQTGKGQEQRDYPSKASAFLAAALITAHLGVLACDLPAPPLQPDGKPDQAWYLYPDGCLQVWLGSPQAFIDFRYLAWRGGRTKNTAQPIHTTLKFQRYPNLQPNGFCSTCANVRVNIASFASVLARELLYKNNTCSIMILIAAASNTKLGGEKLQLTIMLVVGLLHSVTADGHLQNAAFSAAAAAGPALAGRNLQQHCTFTGSTLQAPAHFSGCTTIDFTMSSVNFTSPWKAVFQASEVIMVAATSAASVARSRGVCSACLKLLVPETFSIRFDLGFAPHVVTVVGDIGLLVPDRIQFESSRPQDTMSKFYNFRWATGTSLQNLTTLANFANGFHVCISDCMDGKQNPIISTCPSPHVLHAAQASRRTLPTIWIPAAEPAQNLMHILPPGFLSDAFSTVCFPLPSKAYLASLVPEVVSLMLRTGNAFGITLAFPSNAALSAGDFSPLSILSPSANIELTFNGTLAAWPTQDSRAVDETALELPPGLLQDIQSETTISIVSNHMPVSLQPGSCSGLSSYSLELSSYGGGLRLKSGFLFSGPSGNDPGVPQQTLVKDLRLDIPARQVGVDVIEVGALSPLQAASVAIYPVMATCIDAEVFSDVVSPAADELPGQSGLLPDIFFSSSIVNDYALACTCLGDGLLKVSGLCAFSPKGQVSNGGVVSLCPPGRYSDAEGASGSLGTVCQPCP